MTNVAEQKSQRLNNYSWVSVTAFTEIRMVQYGHLSGLSYIPTRSSKKISLSRFYPELAFKIALSLVKHNQ